MKIKKTLSISFILLLSASFLNISAAMRDGTKIVDQAIIEDFFSRPESIKSLDLDKKHVAESNMQTKNLELQDLINLFGDNFGKEIFNQLCWDNDLSRPILNLIKKSEKKAEFIRILEAAILFEQKDIHASKERLSKFKKMGQRVPDGLYVSDFNSELKVINFAGLVKSLS